MADARPLVLLVDDEPHIRRFLSLGFELRQFRVIEAGTAAEALEKALLHLPDLVVLDLGLPDADGSTVVQRLREWSKAAIIVLSVRSSEIEKVRLLELGADDYVTKPFGIAELLARARGVLRRAARDQAVEPVVVVGRLAIDLGLQLVTLDGRPVSLSPNEFRLLKGLAAHAGKMMTHGQLMQEVWPSGDIQDVQYLRILMRRLRHKIEPDPTQPRYLVTELGVGYRLRTADQIEAAEAPVA